MRLVTSSSSAVLFSIVAAAAASASASSSTSTSTLSSFQMKRDFMAAMHQKPKVAAARTMGREQKLQELNEKLIKASRKLASSSSSYNNYNSNNGGNSQQQQQQAQQQQNYTQGGSSYSNYYNSNGGSGSGSGSGSYNNFLADQEGNLYFQGNDGLYYNAQGQVVEPDQDTGLYPWEYDAIPYDLSSRAFKYAGCAAIKSYDIERAASNGNPMVVDTMAVFRLCPASSCNQYSITGCGKNYGEYTVDVKTYLSYLLSYYDGAYSDYCDYCEPCDYDLQTEKSLYLSECHEQMDQDQWGYYQKIQQQAYQDFLDANGGSDSNAAFHFYGQSPYNNGQGFDAYDGLYYNGAATQNGVNYPSKSSSSSSSSYYQDYAAKYSSSSYNQYGEEDMDDDYYGNRGRRSLGNSAKSQCQSFVATMQKTYSSGGNDGDYYSSWTKSGGYYDENGNYNAKSSSSSSVSNAAMADYWNAQDCCEDGSVCDACQIATESKYGDCDRYICGDYYKYCESNYYGGGDSGVDLSKYLECAEHEDDNTGIIYYIGPHCGSDHYTISLGLFSDENCLEYIGDSVSLSSVIGYTHGHAEDLFKMPEGCISCDASYEPSQGTNQYGEAYYEAPTSDEDFVLAMCSSLSSVAAQCNKNMKNYEQVSRLMDANELAEEARACTFIENIMLGSYEETGEIKLMGSYFDFSEWRDPHHYNRLKMPAGQAVLLSFSIILCVALGAVAVAQTKAIQRKRGDSPWIVTRIFRRRYTVGSRRRRRGRSPSPNNKNNEQLIKTRRPLVPTTTTTTTTTTSSDKEEALILRRRPSLGDTKPPGSPLRDDGDDDGDDFEIVPTPTGVSGIIATRSYYQPPSSSGSSVASSDPTGSYRSHSENNDVV